MDGLKDTPMWDYDQLSTKYTDYQLSKLRNHVPKMTHCMQCGDVFDSQSYHFRPTAIYPYTKTTCSRTCTKLYGGSLNKQIFREYICKGCSKTFTPSKSKPRQIYCNKKCRGLDLKGKARPEMQRWIHKISPPKNSVSSSGTKWLSQFPLTHVEYQIQLDTGVVRVDGYNANTNTVYEYLGSFWHGNPTLYDQSDLNPVTKTTFGHLYENTMSRLDRISAAGYNVIFEWSPK